MSRLPNPGSDADNWGTILNDYLSVELAADGSLKLRTDGTLSNIAHTTGAETIAGVKTFSSSPVVPTPTTNTQAATKAYVDSTASAGTPDADGTTKGKLQLTGDLGGTAASPTVPTKVSKAGGDTITAAAASNKIALTIAQNDTTNNPTGLAITNTGAGAAVKITQTGGTSASTSVGGSFNLDNSANQGAGMVLYTTQASPAGHLFSSRVNNSAFSQSAIYATSSGASHTMNIQYTGTNATAAAIGVVSSNTAFSAFEVTGHELTHGSIKVTHVGPGDNSDANAAAISIDLQGANTAGQGMYITSTTGTTGDAFKIRFNGVEDFVVKNDGKIGMGIGVSGTPGGRLELAQRDDATIGLFIKANSISAANLIDLRNSANSTRVNIDATGNVVMRNNVYAAGSGLQLGSTSSDFGGGIGVLSIKNATTLPTTNPTAGIVLYAEGGVLKYRDPSGVVNLVSSATFSSATPAGGSATAPTAGVASTVARSDHAHPRSGWDASDHGMLSWSFDPSLAVNSTGITLTAGTLYVIKLHIPIAVSVTNIFMYVGTAGGTLTSSQNFAAIYQSGSLIGTTADQSTAWTTTGLKSMALSGGPLALAVGDIYVAVWSNGTTPPTFARGAGTTIINANITTTASRFGTANTGITTAAPSTLGTISAISGATWAGIS